ncbi:MAG: holo-ACP synthase [Nanoarchaeota archaeon]|nr:holo-ACP synthase [Nanoarchaeota archaeon]
MVKIGTDIVKISEFNELSDKAKKKIFQPSEINKNIESLAGIFAAKEAFKKAFGTKINWLDIEIKKKRNGKPMIYLGNKSLESDSDVSISHNGDYAIAVVVYDK